MGKRKKENDTFLWKKAEKKKNIAITVIFLDGKGQFFQWSWNYKGNRLKKHLKKENFKKGLINLIETNHQINMTFDNFVSSNNSFKSHLNSKSFLHCSSCVKHVDSASVSVV